MPAQSGGTRQHRTGVPLVPQTDLFRLECKIESDDDTSLLHRNRDDRKSQPSRANNDDRAWDRKQERAQQEARDRGSSYSSTTTKMKSDERRESPHQDDQKPQEGLDFNTRTSQLPSGPRVPANHSEDRKVMMVANKLTDLLRNIASLSNQAVQDTAKHAENERTLHNYNEMSATLSKISKSAAAAVTNPLADTILNHVRSRERVEANFSALEGEWQKLFQIFTAEITDVIERSVQDALSNLRKEVDGMVQSLRETSSGKRKQTEEDYGRLRGERNEPPRSRRDERSRSRETKRRRTSLRSCSPSPPRKRDGDVLPRVVKASFDDILNEIKGKLDLQGTTLQSLQKENYELKQQLHGEQSPNRAARSSGNVDDDCSSWAKGASSSRNAVAAPAEGDRRGGGYGGYRRESSYGDGRRRA
ncbi:hypothetical protein V5O48_014567 [Marasmius crinis-equi]|uniref:Uncharacterized protein n=1 Tax=Marasmius crinis-equi TaxID=585013 RepID=A0ABR3EX08_9AGAR